MAMPPATRDAWQPRRWLRPMGKRLRQVLIILAVLLVVVTVLFLIVYGVGIQHHHHSTNHGAMAIFTTVV